MSGKGKRKGVSVRHYLSTLSTALTWQASSHVCMTTKPTTHLLKRWLARRLKARRSPVMGSELREKWAPRQVMLNTFCCHPTKSNPGYNVARRCVDQVLARGYNVKCRICWCASWPWWRSKGRVKPKIGLASGRLWLAYSWRNRPSSRWAHKEMFRWKRYLSGLSFWLPPAFFITMHDFWLQDSIGTY